MGKLVEIRNLAAGYDGKSVLRDVCLDICDNDFLGIIGPNGGGKTTLVKCILGLKRPDKGTIRFFDGENPAPRLDIGYLPQYNAIDKAFPISVMEVVLTGLNRRKSFFGGYTDGQRRQARQIIGEMGLEGLEKTPIGKLSGGQMQRALLGRAMVANPRLLILDEPSTYVDKLNETKLYKLLSDINKQCAIMLVSHDIGTILQNVKSIACVNGTLHYHPDTDVDADWLREGLDCPIDLIGHGDIPHRVLKAHKA